MRFSIFATLLAIAATLAVAIPVDTTGSNTSVAPVGEPAKPEHSALALKAANEEKHKTQGHHKSHEKLEKDEDEEEEKEAEAKHKEHEKKDHHPPSTLVRRDITLQQAKDHKKSWSAVEKAHTQAAGTSLTSAAQTQGMDQQIHMTDATSHATAASKARHMSEGYGHVVTAIGHENKAATARTQATRDHHNQQAIDSRFAAANSFQAASQIQATF
ncbi:hypothetical protein FRC17_002984 [Serendipita sp. 399]|nr:hypothetical protein FRC17_002984 [Serendipita sp. 399]